MSEEVNIQQVLSQPATGFVHTHCHSEYSALDGGSKITNMPEKLAEQEMNAMALTDHGVMQGIPEFYDQLINAGIKPILGLEAYLTDDRFKNMESKQDRGTPTWHITLLAENNTGYSNLCKISSWAFIEGLTKVIGRPRARADWDLLDKFSEGIICLTGCMAGPVMSKLMKDGSIAEAKANVQRLISIFGKDNVYGEIQNVGIIVGVPGDSEIAKHYGKTPLSAEEAASYTAPKGHYADPLQEGQVPISQTEANAVLVDICKEVGIAYVGTGDVHYLDEEDALPHDAMICIGTKQVQKGKRKFQLLPKKYHLRTEEEMLQALSDWPESIAESRNIADRCKVELEFHKELLPAFPIPEGHKDAKNYLRHLCLEGLEERYPEGHNLRADAFKRLDYELSVIDNMGYNDYFLIVWDFLNYATSQGIPTGPGRGSAAGAMVAYTLGITKLDPLQHGLLFERFLNPDRKSMPDIDADISQLRREEVIEYVRQKYNKLANAETSVAQVVTFSKFRAKGAIKDAARVLAEPTDEGRSIALKAGDKIASYIPSDPGATMKKVWNDEKGLDGSQLRAAFKRGGFEAEVIKQAGWMEDLVKAYSTHAAAVIISDHDLTDDVPLQKMDPKKGLETQYDMDWAEKIGLLKMDFLGLRNLDIIDETVEKIKHVRGIEIDPYNLNDIPLDDTATYEMLAKGKAVGVFQFESDGMRGALKEIGATEFNDLIAIVSLYRPGPMAHIPTYAARKKGQEKVTFLDPRLEDILGETYGITCYQEQSMLIARELANFTPGQADDLRKAIGKKLRDKMDSLRDPYIKGCLNNGLSKVQAETLWADNEAAADYSFNKSHAACYAYVAYITAYLKCHYPEEYMASLLSSVIGKKQDDKPRAYLTEAKQMKLNVLPPDVNRSLKSFSVMENEEDSSKLDILFGLTAIGGVGDKVVQQLIDERKIRGPYTSMYDLVRRLPNLNKATLISLAQAGALENLQGSRKAQAEEAEEVIKETKKRLKAKQKSFADSIKSWIEDNPRPEDPVNPSGKNKGKRKLTILDKRAIEGACLKAMDVEGEVAYQDIYQETLAAVKKEALRAAKADFRKQLKESGGIEAIVGIADEDSSVDEKTLIEEAGEEKVAEQLKELTSYTEDMTKQCVIALAKVAEEKAAQAGFALAMEEEADPKLSEEEWDNIVLLNNERSKLGTYVSGHPLDKDKVAWANYVSQALGNIDDKLLNQKIRVVGALVNKRPIPTWRGDVMYKVSLEDLTGSREITIFPQTLEGGIEEMLELGKVLVFEARVEEDTFAKSKKEEAKEDEGVEGLEGVEGEIEDESIPVQLIASRVYYWKPERVKIHGNNNSSASDTEVLELKLASLKPEVVEEVKKAAKQHSGDKSVRLVLPNKTAMTQLKVDGSKELLDKFKQLSKLSAE